MAPKTRSGRSGGSAAGKKRAQPEASSDADELVRRKLARKHGDEAAFQAPKQPAKAEKGSEAAGEKPRWVEINRAPVLTAWVAAVAECEGYSPSAALTFGKAIAGMFAASKGRSIGVIEPKEQSEEERAAKREQEAAAGVQHVEVFGTRIKALQAGGELRAAEAGSKKAVEPSAVQAYLQRAFKDRLGEVQDAMRQLAASFPQEQIGGEAYRLYEAFRPSVPQGKQGWGLRGRLDLDQLLQLRQQADGGGQQQEAAAAEAEEA